VNFDEIKRNFKDM
jgi:hypothetical protein